MMVGRFQDDPDILWVSFCSFFSLAILFDFGGLFFLFSDPWEGQTANNAKAIRWFCLSFQDSALPTHSASRLA